MTSIENRIKRLERATICEKCGQRLPRQQDQSPDLDLTVLTDEDLEHFRRIMTILTGRRESDHES